MQYKAQRFMGFQPRIFLGITVQNSSAELRFQYPRSIYLRSRLNTDTSVGISLCFPRRGSDNFLHLTGPRRTLPSSLSWVLQPRERLRVLGEPARPRCAATEPREAAGRGALKPRCAVEFHSIGQYFKQM